MSTGRNGINQSKEYLNKSDISKPGEKNHGEHVKDEIHGYEKKRAKGPITSLSGVPNKMCW